MTPSGIHLHAERSDVVAQDDRRATVRIAVRAWAPEPQAAGAPSLVVDGPTGRVTLAARPHGSPTAGPDWPAWSIDVDVPRELLAGASWWLVPGEDHPAPAQPPAADAAAAPLRAALEDLRAIQRSVGRLEASLGASTPPPPSPRADRSLRFPGSDTTAATRTRPKAAPTPKPKPPPRRRPGTSRILPVAMFTAGSLVVADSLLTVLWQEPISAIYAARQQAGLDGELDDLERSLSVQPVAVPVLPRARPDPAARMPALARRLRAAAGSGKAIGRLSIPRMGTNTVFVEGTGTKPLRRGPGHYSVTALPGEGDTVAIAGHRTTYGAPFKKIDRMRRGDRITVRMPYGTFTYSTVRRVIVSPENTRPLRPVGRERIVLTACHPLYSAAQRMVVTARLIRAVPRGAALREGPTGSGGDAAGRPRRA